MTTRTTIDDWKAIEKCLDLFDDNCDWPVSFDLDLVKKIIVIMSTYTTMTIHFNKVVMEVD